MTIVETICERCGQINDHLTCHCEALALPLCRVCGDQHHAQVSCAEVREIAPFMAAWRRSLLAEVEAMAAVTAARRLAELPF